jgi:hypothetical protein
VKHEVHAVALGGAQGLARWQVLHE